MAFLHLSTIAILALRAVSVLAQAEPVVEPVDGGSDAPRVSPNIAVKVSASFPQAEIFGVKLVNGHKTEALLSIENEDTTSVNVAVVGGSLWGPDPKTQGQTDRIVRNLTSTRFNIQVPPGEKESISYSFATELHPQELRLNIVAVLMSDQGGLYTMNAFNQTVSIVEPDASIFDPQLIFLYLMLLGLFAGSCYFIYNTWIATLFPQSKKPVKTGARKSTGGAKPGDSNIASSPSAESTAATTGATTYDESWIPAGHLQRPEAKRTKSSGKPKNRGKTE